LTCQDVANKFATSLQPVIVMEFGKWHDTTDTNWRDFWPCQLVTDFLRTCYGETGVMDFWKMCYGEVANSLRTCYGEVATLLQTCYGLVIYVVDLFWNNC